MIRACSRSRLRNPQTFTPLNLFLAGELGAWYDPSDITTLFQDAAGTIPVTGTGQPVGLMLDKSGQGHHASQTTAASRPTYTESGGLQYLLFDGVNDFLVTASIDLTATDEMSLFAGIRKLSDAARGMVCEFSVNVGLNNGTFFLDAPTSAANNISFAARGAGSAGVPLVSGLVAPISLAVSADANISADSARVRTNGGTYTATATDMGAGNFGNYPLYIGNRGGVSLPFSGHLYSLVIRNSLTTAAVVSSTELYVAQKSGVTL